MQHEVFWHRRRPPPLPPLEGVVHADAVVVGGGMMGLMCARSLVARGLKVALVEARTCGDGASGRSSGFVTPDSELEFRDLVERLGPEDGSRVWRFAWSGVDGIRKAVLSDAIDCDCQPADALFVAATRRGEEAIGAEQKARQALGFASALHSRDQLPHILGSTSYFAGIRFGGTFGIDAYRCCTGLRSRLLAAGARVFENSPVTRIAGNGVETLAGAVRAPALFICVDRFLPSLGIAPREIHLVQTILGITRPVSEADAAKLFPAGPLMVWDTGLIYKYFRLTGERRLLIGGGSLAGTYATRSGGGSEKGAAALSHYLCERFPGLDFSLDACWPGLIGVSKDFLPVAGSHPRHSNVRFAAGATGLPLAAALGRYLAEAAIDGRGELDALLSPDRRFPVGPAVQDVIGTTPAFALSHGLLKYLPGHAPGGRKASAGQVSARRGP